MRELRRYATPSCETGPSRRGAPAARFGVQTSAGALFRREPPGRHPRHAPLSSQQHVVAMANPPCSPGSATRTRLRRRSPCCLPGDWWMTSGFSPFSTRQRLRLLNRCAVKGIVERSLDYGRLWRRPPARRFCGPRRAPSPAAGLVLRELTGSTIRPGCCSIETRRAWIAFLLGHESRLRSAACQSPDSAESHGEDPPQCGRTGWEFTPADRQAAVLEAL